MARLLLAAYVVALVVACVSAASSKAEGYGAVSYAYAQRMEHYIHAWFDSRGIGSTMVCIARRESGMNPRAYNDDFAPAESVAGLFQIKWPLWSGSNPRIPTAMKRFWHWHSISWQQFRRRLSDPVQSIRLAFLLYRHGGLGPWGGSCH